MRDTEINRRLWEIKEAHKGGDFDYNTMFKVDRDAREAKELVKELNPRHPCLKYFDEAIELAVSKSKEETESKKMATGSLEEGISLFFRKA
jgi:hypothetical protein